LRGRHACVEASHMRPSHTLRIVLLLAIVEEKIVLLLIVVEEIN